MFTLKLSSYLLSKLKKYINIEDSLKTYKILIRPILEYCSTIYMYLDATQKVTETIEKVQNLYLIHLVHN